MPSGFATAVPLDGAEAIEDATTASPSGSVVVGARLERQGTVFGDRHRIVGNDRGVVDRMPRS